MKQPATNFHQHLLALVVVRKDRLVNNNNNNLYLSVKAKIAVTEPLNGDTISEIYIYININVNIKVLKIYIYIYILNKLCTLI